MEKIKEVQEHFKFTLTDEWSNECDFYIYEETTADGYSVYIASNNTDVINVNEDVYYYDSDLDYALVEFITCTCAEGKKSIYVDDIDSDFVEKAMSELYKRINKI